MAEDGPAPDVVDGPPAAFVFKTVVDPYVGHLNLFRVLQGTIEADATLVNDRTAADERLHQLVSLRGKEQAPLTAVGAGDIAAVAKLADTTTGDVLGTRGADLDVERLEPPRAGAARRDPSQVEGRRGQARQRAAPPPRRGPGDPHRTQRRDPPDPALGHRRDPSRRSRSNGCRASSASRSRPTTSRSPTGRRSPSNADAEGRYKKQTGGHGQFGVAFLRVEPRERGAGFEFTDSIVGGSIPRQFIPAVEKGVAETMGSGGVYGYPVVDVGVTVYDGKYHSVDSSEMSFKMAGSIGFKEAMAKANPILLEPISELVVTAPEDVQGDIMGDLNSKRGRIQGTGSVGGGEVEIVALVPTSEILRYAIDLRSLTGGRGRFELHHSHYDPVPPQLVTKLAAAS